MPPTIGRDNVVTRDGQRVVVQWADMTQAERNEITMANVNRCPVKFPESVSAEQHGIRLAM
jgi:hypothetical protein